MQHLTQTQVLIIGAGPAGLGVAAALKQAGVEDLIIVDAKEIGASFLAWPKGMSLLTPSFYSNAFGLTDLNAIDPVTSPADFLRTQHPTGPAYAAYLKAVAENYQLHVATGIVISSVEISAKGFIVHAAREIFHATYVIWAGGQFSQPREQDFPGAELAIHSSKISDWSALEGDHFTIIGGYESGIDAALNLIHLGKSVRLVSRGEPWTSDHPDPSRSLSPRTLDRLRDVLKTPALAAKVEFMKNANITRIEAGEGFWTLRDQDEIPLASTTRPILANGFHSGLGLVSHLFEHDPHGLPVFTEEADESTITPGLFYTGPSLVHRNSLFCFIYKFRSRFGIIAAEIATRLGLPDVEEKMIPYLESGFMNDDLDCCTTCQCAIEPESTAPTPASFAASAI